MLINDLNDDCLLLIFSYINDFYDQLNISQVCSRWSSLLSIRYNRKKLLLCWSSYSGPDEVEYITRAPNFIRNNITRLLPSVQLLDVNFKHHRDLTIDKLNEIGQNHLNIKGIVVQKGCIDLFLLLCFPNIEMLVCSYLLHNKNYPFDISKLRQLYIRNGSLKVLSRYGRSLNNLQRLHLYQGQHFEVYSGEIIPNLRILEYDSENDRELENDFDGFHFMDFCPSLESAYLAHRSKKCIMDSKNLNLNLRDLVILQL
ncbi:uncharacterized protein LOC128397392 isoform X2 [Panonychus citri]|uniref:uncharacterized protein LOC128397392 isoform X2 n=1 Tax=Panonychus citri TaxID=50023 RepID=UPI0023082C5C|nr:uncharacterized protein LOC128397392 isoform X2 [Panonychus citri]